MRKMYGRMIAVLGMMSCLPFISSCDWAKADNLRGFVGEEDKPAKDIPLEFHGKAEQASTMIGKTIPFSVIDAAGIRTTADSDGYFVFGFDRDAPKTATITITTPDGYSKSKTFAVAKRDYVMKIIKGLPPDTVNPPQDLLNKIDADQSIKQLGLSSRDDNLKGYLQNFSYPLKEFIVTSPWGADRSLNGNELQPHYGIDLAAPLGTPIYAPADGKIVIAQEGMLIEGGMVAIDHGQGLISMYLHQKNVKVKVGQMVHKGDIIGAVGKEGRATGPHLCWRMRWRGRQIDPVSLVNKSDRPTSNRQIQASKF